MSRNDIQIKVADTWHIYRWDSSDGALYVSGLILRAGRPVRNDSRIGSASSLQDAITLAKARCNATRHATVRTKAGGDGRPRAASAGTLPVRPWRVRKTLRTRRVVSMAGALDTAV